MTLDASRDARSGRRRAVEAGPLSCWPLRRCLRALRHGGADERSSTRTRRSRCRRTSCGCPGATTSSPGGSARASAAAARACCHGGGERLAGVRPVQAPRDAARATSRGRCRCSSGRRADRRDDVLPLHGHAVPAVRGALGSCRRRGVGRVRGCSKLISSSRYPAACRSPRDSRVARVRESTAQTRRPSLLVFRR